MEPAIEARDCPSRESAPTPALPALARPRAEHAPRAHPPTTTGPTFHRLTPPSLDQGEIILDIVLYLVSLPVLVLVFLVFLLGALVECVRVLVVDLDGTRPPRPRPSV